MIRRTTVGGGCAEAVIKVAKDGVATAVEAQENVRERSCGRISPVLLFTRGVTTTAAAAGKTVKPGIDRNKALQKLTRGGRLCT